MKRIFYNDKVIIFSKKGNSDSLNVDKLSVELFLEAINSDSTLKSVVVVSPSPNEAYNAFIEGFKRVTAAGGVVKNSANEVLFIYRNGYWDLPKGKQDKGEDIEVCAVREVTEETSVDELEIVSSAPYITEHIYNTYGRWELKSTYWYAMRCVGSEGFNNTSFQQEEGITECRWVAESEALTLVKDSYSTIRDVIEQYIITNKFY